MRQTDETYRVNKELSGNFTMLLNDNLRDPSMSNNAKMLHAVMLSFPHDWEFHLSHLDQYFKEGRDQMRKAMKELMARGFVVRREKPKTAGGKYTGYEYIVFEVPQNIATPSPEPEKPEPENQLLEIREYINTNNTNTDNTNASDDAESNFSKPELPRPPASRGWPGDVRDLAVAFSRRFKRDAYSYEVARWIKSLRSRYLKLGITVSELERMYDFAERDRITIKSPDSLLYTIDKVRPPQAAKPVVLGPSGDGGTLLRYANGVIATVYGSEI